MVKKVAIAVAIAIALLSGALTLLIAKHRAGVAEADEQWETNRPPPLGTIGTTRSLEIVPLVDWHASRDDLVTDMGVSYLVRTDELTILFDTGNNSENLQPSPLEQNMKTLDIGLDEIDAVVISHAHYDHVGGKQWTDGAISGTTFGIGNARPDLAGKKVVTPIDMTYPGIEPDVGTKPMKLADGVATTGTIPRKLLPGWIDEQALAIHVEGKGLVLIVGCGHQTLKRLIERTERVFDAPIYGVVGGLHYPVPEGRITKLGLNVQRLGASGGGPLRPLTAEEIESELTMLEARNPGLVGIGGHDSSDQVIADAAERFGDAYHHVKVGLPITVE